MSEGDVFYLIGTVPEKLGCVELFARDLSRALLARGRGIVLCFEGPPAPRVRAALDLPNVTLEVIPRQTETGPAQAAAFARLVAKHRPGVVVYAFNGLLKPYPWIARALGVKRVYFNDHSSRWDGDLTPRQAWKQQVGRAVAAPIDGVICVSRFVQECVRARGCVAPERVHVVHNGVDLRAADDAAAQARAFRARYGIAEGSKVVAQVSWITRRKGIEQLLRAAVRVVAEVPEAVFVVGGQGGRRAEYQRLAATLGVADRVIWTGALEQPTAEGVYAAADVCCQLSQWHEAFGVTITEAMSFSRPVVATRVGGIPELIEHGETGFLVERDDVPGMARHVVALLRDDALRARMGRAARRAVESRFDLARTVNGYLDILGVGLAEGARAVAGGSPIHPPGEQGTVRT